MRTGIVVRLAMLGAMVAVAPVCAVPQTSDSAAVVEASHALLRAISAHDTAAARRVMMPGAHLVAVMQPAAPTGMPRMQSDTAFYRSLGSGGPALLERMWQPVVQLHGSVATVHAPYDFHASGKFSHCGVDVFTLVRVAGEWRISSVTYTVQRAGCAPSPLGPPAP